MHVQAVVDEKFAELKEENKNRQGGNREGGGANHVIDGEVAPSDVKISKLGQRSSR